MTTCLTKLENELFSACKAGDVDKVRRAIAAGVDPKKAINRDLIMNFAGYIYGETPLHTACRHVMYVYHCIAVHLPALLPAVES